VTKATSLPQVETLEITDSTNAEAKRRAASGVRGPLWLRADTQSDGVGRSGREWYSPKGNLFTTLLMPINGELRDAALVSFVACLAVADTLDAYAPLSLVSLKWPNDALLDGKKVAGVLLEAGGELDKRWLAVGIGINLVHKPSEARWPPIALAEVSSPPSPDEALETLAQSFDAWQTQFETSGFLPIRDAWLSRAAHIREPIEARLADVTHTGVFQGIAEDGALLLAKDDGTIRITAADIYFPAE